MTEDSIVGWHHRLYGHEFEQALEMVKDREASCPWGCRESDTAEQLNNCSCFHGGSDGKESACNLGDPGSIPDRKYTLEKGMATHSSILAWRIPWTEEPGGLLSVGSQRIGLIERLAQHNCSCKSINCSVLCRISFEGSPSKRSRTTV